MVVTRDMVDNSHSKMTFCHILLMDVLKVSNSLDYFIWCPVFRKKLPFWRSSYTSHNICL